MDTTVVLRHIYGLHAGSDRRWVAQTTEEVTIEIGSRAIRGLFLRDDEQMVFVNSRNVDLVSLHSVVLYRVSTSCNSDGSIDLTSVKLGEPLGKALMIPLGIWQAWEQGHFDVRRLDR
jgi:hypothetical protein